MVSLVSGLAGRARPGHEANRDAQAKDHGEEREANAKGLAARAALLFDPGQVLRGALRVVCERHARTDAVESRESVTNPTIVTNPFDASVDALSLADKQGVAQGDADDAAPARCVHETHAARPSLSCPPPCPRPPVARRCVRRDQHFKNEARLALGVGAVRGKDARHCAPFHDVCCYFLLESFCAWRTLAAPYPTCPLTCAATVCFPLFARLEVAKLAGPARGAPRQQHNLQARPHACFYTRVPRVLTPACSSFGRSEAQQTAFQSVGSARASILLSGRRVWPGASCTFLGHEPVPGSETRRIRHGTPQRSDAAAAA